MAPRTEPTLCRTARRVRRSQQCGSAVVATWSSSTSPTHSNTSCGRVNLGLLLILLLGMSVSFLSQTASGAVTNKPRIGDDAGRAGDPKGIVPPRVSVSGTPFPPKSSPFCDISLLRSTPQCSIRRGGNGPWPRQANSLLASQSGRHNDGAEWALASRVHFLGQSRSPVGGDLIDDRFSADRRGGIGQADMIPSRPRPDNCALILFMLARSTSQNFRTRLRRIRLRGMARPATTSPLQSPSCAIAQPTTPLAGPW